MHQRIADALTPTRRGHLGVLEIEHVFGDVPVEELGFSLRKGDDEAFVLGLMPDGQSVEAGPMHGAEPNGIVTTAASG